MTLVNFPKIIFVKILETCSKLFFRKQFLSRVLSLEMLRSKNLATEIDDIVWQPQIFLDEHVLFHNTKMMIMLEKTKDILSNILNI